MKENANSKLWKCLCLATIAIGIAATPVVQAKSKSKSTAGNRARVVAHLELSGGPVTRMLLLKKGTREFLLLGLDSSPQVAILDVSVPDQPHTVTPAAGIGTMPVSELKVVADTLTLFGTPDRETASSSEPKEIRSLSGVTALVKDKAHGLIYVTNGDGLWIVKSKHTTDSDAIPDYYGGGG
jgi:hypothetical protein